MASKPLKKIVLADDEEDILEVTKFALEDLTGVSVSYCRSGEEALQEALRVQPDLIILDFMMPGMDGAATLKAIKTTPALASTPVFFMTAKIQRSEKEEYLKMGASGVIAKPFDPLTLADTIKKMWEEQGESALEISKSKTNN